MVVGSYRKEWSWMAQTILVKTGLKVNLPTLLGGELGLCTDTNKVYGGNGT